MSEELTLRKREIALFLQLCDLQPQEVFTEILGDDTDKKGKSLFEFLTHFKGSKSQINHFLQFVYFTEDINKWMKFIDHEFNKRESPWKDKTFKELIDRLNDWLKKPYDPNQKDNKVDNKLQRYLNEYTSGKVSPTEDTYKNWRLYAIKRAISESLKATLKKKKT